MRTIFGSPVLWIGVALFVISSIPVDLFPLGMFFGILTIWPSVILIVIGLGLGIAEYWGIYVRLWVVVVWISLAMMAVAIARHVFGLF